MMIYVRGIVTISVIQAEIVMILTYIDEQEITNSYGTLMFPVETN